VAEWVVSGGLLVGIGATAVRAAVSTERRAQLRVLTRVRARRAERAAAAASIDDPVFSPENIRASVTALLETAEKVWNGIDGRKPRRPRDVDPISHALISAPLIESPAMDDERLREAGLRELAGQERAPKARLGELIDGDAPAPDRLRELSVLDDRFSPELLEATIDRVLEAWEALTDGSQRPLEQVAAGPAIQALMYADRRHGRRLIRDPELAGWEVLGVDASSKPPWVRVRIEIKGAVFGNDGSRAFGSDRQRRKYTLIWTLELAATAGHDVAWRLAASADA
jgi:hypothetical protein